MRAGTWRDVVGLGRGSRAPGVGLSSRLNPGRERGGEGPGVQSTLLGVPRAGPASTEQPTCSQAASCQITSAHGHPAVLRVLNCRPVLKLRSCVCESIKGKVPNRGKVLDTCGNVENAPGPGIGDLSSPTSASSCLQIRGVSRN